MHLSVKSCHPVRCCRHSVEITAKSYFEWSQSIALWVKEVMSPDAGRNSGAPLRVLPATTVIALELPFVFYHVPVMFRESCFCGRGEQSLWLTSSRSFDRHPRAATCAGTGSERSALIATLPLVDSRSTTVAYCSCFC